jgi:hypothetical protein
VRSALGLLILVACSRSEPSERDLVAGAQDETRKFFALGEAGDCERLAPMLQRPQSCEGLVRQFRETHVHLSKIEGAKLDGRDKHVVLVTVEAVAPERTHRWIVQAKWTAGGWKFAL